VGLVLDPDDAAKVINRLPAAALAGTAVGIVVLIAHLLLVPLPKVKVSCYHFFRPLVRVSQIESFMGRLFH
jgi:hypothetical protein